LERCGSFDALGFAAERHSEEFGLIMPAKRSS
jgi:hypothetical protein